MLTIQFPEGKFDFFSHFQASPDPTNVVALSIAASVASKYVGLKHVPEMVFLWDGMGWNFPTQWTWKKQQLETDATWNMKPWLVQNGMFMMAFFGTNLITPKYLGNTYPPLYNSKNQSFLSSAQVEMPWHPIDRFHIGWQIIVIFLFLLRVVSMKGSSEISKQISRNSHGNSLVRISKEI